MKRRLLIAVVAIIFLIGGILIYFRFNSGNSKPSSQFQTQMLVRGPLVSIVEATGTVRANQSTSLNWLTSGRIAKIYVQTGDKVQPGEVLAELDPASLPQSIIMAQADLIDAQHTLDNLKDSQAAQAQAAVNLANAQSSLQDAKKKRDYKNFPRGTPPELDQARADLIVAADTFRTALENYDAVVGMADDNPIKASALSAMASARIKRDQAHANLNWLQAKPDAIEMAQADAAVELAQSKLEDAQREWERLKNGVDPQDVLAAQAKVDSILATLSNAYLKSPINGTVTVSPLKVGDEVTPASEGFQIDDLSNLYVDVQVPEVDINKMAIGQTAQLTFDAISNKTYNGKVSQVSKLGITTAGVVDYTVTIEMSDADASVLTGMTAAVNIVVKQLNDVLLAPNKTIKRINGATDIYLLKNNTAQLTEIQIGAYSDSESEITGGDVKAGDLVILNPPATRSGLQGGGGGATNNGNSGQ